MTGFFFCSFFRVFLCVSMSVSGWCGPTPFQARCPMYTVCFLCVADRECLVPQQPLHQSRGNGGVTRRQGTDNEWTAKIVHLRDDELLPLRWDNIELFLTHVRCVVFAWFCLRGYQGMLHGLRWSARGECINCTCWRCLCVLFIFFFILFFFTFVHWPYNNWCFGACSNLGIW